MLYLLCICNFSAHCNLLVSVAPLQLIVSIVNQFSIGLGKGKIIDDLEGAQMT